MFIMQRAGKVHFNRYMKYLYEAYKSVHTNIDNKYAVTWSFMTWSLFIKIN